MKARKIPASALVPGELYLRLRPTTLVEHSGKAFYPKVAAQENQPCN